MRKDSLDYLQKPFDFMYFNKGKTTFMVMCGIVMCLCSNWSYGIVIEWPAEGKWCS